MGKPLISQYHRPLGLTLICYSFIIAGLAGLLITLMQVLASPSISNFFTQTAFLRDLIFYSGFSPFQITGWLIVQLCVSIALTTLGIFLLLKSIVALHISRIFMILVAAFFLVNPYYADKFLFVITPLLSVIIFYLFHHKVRIYFYDIPTDHVFIDKSFLKSRLTVLFSSIELFISLLLFRISFWELPLSGIVLTSKLGDFLTFTLTIPKIELILLSSMLFIASLLTINFRPIGRMINILLCLLLLMVGIFHLFFVIQPKQFGIKLHFLITITSLLSYSFIYFFLLTNPTVKEQFKTNADDPFAPRIIGLLTFGTFCFSLLLFLRLTSSYFPRAYESPITVKRLQVKNEKIRNMGQKFKDLYRSSLF